MDPLRQVLRGRGAGVQCRLDVTKVFRHWVVCQLEQPITDFSMASILVGSCSRMSFKDPLQHPNLHLLLTALLVASKSMESTSSEELHLFRFKIFQSSSNKSLSMSSMSLREPPIQLDAFEYVPKCVLLSPKSDSSSIASSMLQSDQTFNQQSKDDLFSSPSAERMLLRASSYRLKLQKHFVLTMKRTSTLVCATPILLM